MPAVTGEGCGNDLAASGGMWADAKSALLVADLNPLLSLSSALDHSVAAGARRLLVSRAAERESFNDSPVRAAAGCRARLFNGYCVYVAGLYSGISGEALYRRSALQTSCLEGASTSDS